MIAYIEWHILRIYAEVEKMVGTKQLINSCWMDIFTLQNRIRKKKLNINKSQLICTQRVETFW